VAVVTVCVIENVCVCVCVCVIRRKCVGVGMGGRERERESDRVVSVWGLKERESGSGKCVKYI
jgi:hypothetical protein